MEEINNMGIEKISTVGAREVLIKKFADKYFKNDKEKAEENQPVVISRKEIEEIIEKGGILENILNLAVESGYVLHGSPYELKKIEPRQVNGARDEENLNAVYATNLVPVALFCAIKSDARAKELALKNRGYIDLHSNWDIGGDDEVKVGWSHFAASREIIDTLGDGFIYIMPKNDFKYNGGDYIREEEYVPRLMVQIKRDDFKYKIEKI